MLKTIFSLFLSVLAVGLLAQNQANLFIEFVIKDADTKNRLAGTKIRVIQDGVLQNQLVADKNGKFDLYLDYNHEFIVEVAKDPYVTKKIYYNTKNVPEEDKEWGHEWGTTEVTMLKKLDGVDYSILEQPIGKIYYDSNSGNFVFDKVYTKEVQRQIQKLEEEHKQRVAREEQLKRQREADFQLAMRDAENAIKDNDFLTAKDNLLAAASMKPDDPGPKKRLEEVEQKLNSEGQKEERYLSLLANADQLFGQEKYQEAKLKYQEASGIKPAEAYPKERVKECDAGILRLKAQQEAERALAEADRKYREEIEKGDKDFMAGNFRDAKTSYQNAISLKSEETYPAEQLKLIEQKLAELAQTEAQKKADAEINARYMAQIDKADAAFNSKNYDNATTLYAAALNIKPAEEYPKNQLALIEERTTEMKAQQLAEEEAKRIAAAYKDNVAQGDKLFASANYEQARAKYQSAAELKPEEQYPKERLTAIDAKLADLEKQRQLEAGKKALDDQYNTLIAAGDKAVQSSDYDLARDQFTQARELKPGEKYPQQQLDMIANLEAKAQRETAEKQRLEAEKAELDKRYADALADADAALAASNYTLAREKYTLASTIKASERYPKDQLAEISRLIAAAEQNTRDAAEQAKIDAAYQARIAEADQLFSDEKYEQAKTSYNLAAGIKPSEEHPARQLAKIETILKDRQLASQRAEEEQQQAKTDAAYQQLVATADGFMDTEDYDNARKKYEEAAALKPSETYPRNQLEKIKQRYDELAARNAEENQRKAQYNRHVREGDQAILDKQWNKAREAYRAASALYENEPFPKSRLGEIDELERKEREEQVRQEYNRLIAEADQAFLNKEYETALVSYERALQAIANDPHATARISKINELLAGQVTSPVRTEEIAERKITEESYEEGRSKITIRKVTLGDKEDVYKRVEHSWGGKYYFLNDRPISELVWNRETN